MGRRGRLACPKGPKQFQDWCSLCGNSGSLHSASHSMREWEAPVGMTIRNTDANLGHRADEREVARVIQVPAPCEKTARSGAPQT